MHIILSYRTSAGDKNGRHALSSATPSPVRYEQSYAGPEFGVIRNERPNDKKKTPATTPSMPSFRKRTREYARLDETEPPSKLETGRSSRAAAAVAAVNLADQAEFTVPDDVGSDYEDEEEEEEEASVLASREAHRNPLRSSETRAARDKPTSFSRDDKQAYHRRAFTPERTIGERDSNRGRSRQRDSDRATSGSSTSSETTRASATTSTHRPARDGKRLRVEETSEARRSRSRSRPRSKSMPRSRRGERSSSPPSSSSRHKTSTARSPTTAAAATSTTTAAQSNVDSTRKRKPSDLPSDSHRSNHIVIDSHDQDDHEHGNDRADRSATRAKRPRTTAEGPTGTANNDDELDVIIKPPFEIKIYKMDPAVELTVQPCGDPTLHKAYFVRIDIYYARLYAC
jgi:hypothetical protein